MANFSNFLELELLDHVLRNAAYTAPTSVWIALFDATGSTANLEAGTLTGEIVGGAYARLEVGGASGRSFTLAAAGATQNNEDWTWTTATADWGTVTYCAVMDASTAGNVLFYGTLTVAKTVNNGDTFKFNAGDFTVTLD